MAYVSLEGSLRTCKVDTSWANRLESDRFLNPNAMVCPAWNGIDTTGRTVCSDSYYTKKAGCHSAADRVMVENALRPQYIEYVNLNAAGIRGGQQCQNVEGYGNINPDTMCHAETLNDARNRVGQFGTVTGFSQYIYPNCLSCPKYAHRSQM
jgi:hypothetical protein